jgi:uncharacterized membrane protein YfcA
MTVLSLTALLAAGSFLAGALGAMTGLGGGVVIVPLLVLVLHVDIRYAVGASLVSVIATSSGAAAAFVREGYSNVRVGMFLEVATTIGALCGAALAGKLSTAALAVTLGIVLLYGAVQSSRPHGPQAIERRADRLATLLRLDGSYPTPSGPVAYHVSGVAGGFGLMWIAGVLSGLLGIGSGGLKVLAMDRSMKLPFKVSTTTSNFMIGVTAAASASVYLHRGYIDPGLSMPVMLGVLGGSFFGARVLARARSVWLRRLFVVVITALAVELIYNGLTGQV